jgi:hypothetical protein
MSIILRSIRYQVDNRRSDTWWLNHAVIVAQQLHRVHYDPSRSPWHPAAS